MAKLDVYENKTLKLDRVLCKELRMITFDTLDREIQKFNNFLEVNRLEIKGPLVIHNLGTPILQNQIEVADYRIIIQLQEEFASQGDYTYIPELKVENCLYLHYEGTPDYSALALSKLAIHMYENDYVGVGEVYQVILQNEQEHIVVDYFQPFEVI